MFFSLKFQMNFNVKIFDNLNGENALDISSAESNGMK